MILILWDRGVAIPDEKITLDEFYSLLDEPVTLLVAAIERIGLEMGIPIKPGAAREIIEVAIEDIHVRDFAKNKIRKFEKWTRRQFKKLKRFLS